MENRANSSNKKADAYSLGVVFIIIGTAILIAQFVDLGSVLFLLVALTMIGIGIVRRNKGWFIPGGILTGMGTGVLLVEETALLGSAANEEVVFLLTLAGGFALITILSALFTERALMWPLIPAGLTAVVGGAFLLGGAAVEVMEVVGRYWPVLFIALGIAVIVKQVMGNREEA